MKKQILSIALALPTVLLGAIPSLADNVTPAPIKVENQKIAPGALQAPQVKPGLLVPQQSNIQINPGGHEAPGPGATVKPPPPPKPPRREDTLFQNRGIVQPRLNTR